MNTKQRTIKAPLTIAGVGLHTGQQVTMTLHPAPENHWYRFRRVDLADQPIVLADADNVTDTSRGTTISQNGASVSTIEHLLASLVAMEIDNILIEIDGPEVPIMDGSSSFFTEALDRAGYIVQKLNREYYTIPHNIHYT